jgi:hypothetical protein
MEIFSQSEEVDENRRERIAAAVVKRCGEIAEFAE